MSRFFVNEVNGDDYIIVGEDAKHIIKSLRMKIGEQITLCDCNRIEYKCKIIEISSDEVKTKVLDKRECINEPKVNVTLYQGLPKGDKMDLIVQKAVELGIHKIVPVIMDRCISRPDNKTACKKVQRWQKISEQAAKQSRRGIIPEVSDLIDIETAINHASNSECIIVFYECGGEKLVDVVDKSVNDISIFIGPEGGFEKKEVDNILRNGGRVATLGNRILRTETASLMATSIIMHITDNI